jgi:hypothetical protein
MGIIIIGRAALARRASPSKKEGAAAGFISDSE